MSAGNPYVALQKDKKDKKKKRQQKIDEKKH
jgi:hypothetical protein